MRITPASQLTVKNEHGNDANTLEHRKKAAPQSQDFTSLHGWSKTCNDLEYPLRHASLPQPNDIKHQ